MEVKIGKNVFRSVDQPIFVRLTEEEINRVTDHMGGKENVLSAFPQGSDRNEMDGIGADGWGVRGTVIETEEGPRKPEIIIADGLKALKGGK